MPEILELKNDFAKKKEKLFQDTSLRKDSLAFCKRHTLLVENYIKDLTKGKNYSFALASAGSFSRNELSPFSDIDLMFIAESFDHNNDDITDLVKLFWDSGIEASHTIRDFSDIKKYLKEDLHTFTQFFETKFLLGNRAVYDKWNKQIFSFLNPKSIKNLFTEFFGDINDRYEKYGDSPKVLEPNVKLSAGGLRDFQAIEWMYILKNKTLINKDDNTTQAEAIVKILKENDYTTENECTRLLEGYALILGVRNLIHLFSQQKNDRFEFNLQQKVSSFLVHKKDALAVFMHEYFKAANVINRFSKSMLKIFQEEISNPLPDSLSIELDDDYIIKGKTIYYIDENEPTLSDILRGFYYRGLYNGYFDESFRSLIIEVVEHKESQEILGTDSSVFFREILKLPKNVGQTLTAMNELGVLSAFLPEFEDLIGFLQHGVYHCYTADEHTLITIKNLEMLEKDTSPLGKIYNSLKNREILHLALLFHDIAKPINISGHEIIGAEMASSIMNRLGYSDDEIDHVIFLVRNHLVMEQVAFRRNLNDPETLNNFTSRFTSIGDLDLLYLVTYADLSAVNPAVWTSWKSDLLSELYMKSHSMLEEQISGEELIKSSTYIVPKEISKHSPMINESHVQEHIDAINDIAYAHQFSDQEIAKHIEEIQKGDVISSLFTELNDFTNVTVITKDFPSLLSKLCGVFSINDANIHDAKIFTRKDEIVIDTFNLSDFRTGRKIEPQRYDKISKDLKAVVSGMMQLNQEFAKMKSRWWRIENKFFKRSGKVKVVFEKHKTYTIIDIYSPDRLGFLFQVTKKMNELGLMIYFAKIATRGDDIVDAFYVLNRNGKKISVNDYEFIKEALTETINQML